MVFTALMANIDAALVNGTLVSFIYEAVKAVVVYCERVSVIGAAKVVPETVTELIFDA